MRRALVLTITIAMLAGCTSASSSETILPGQVRAGEPTEEAPDFGEPPPKRLPPPPNDTMPDGCPSTRSLDAEPATIASAEELRATIIGIYRTCAEQSGLELRADPDEPNRVLWYRLDARFVRQTGIHTSGWFDIGECSTYGCDTTVYTDGHLDPGGFTTLTLWSDPIAISTDSTWTGGRDEWVRVAK